MTAARSRVAVAVIVPAYREPEIASALDALLDGNDPDELIVALADRDAETDGAVDAWRRRRDPGSTALHVSRGARGRARQMIDAARAAASPVLLFLHVDVRLPAGALDLVRASVARGAWWGRFDVRLSGRHPLLRLVERAMNWRSAVSGIATGDQAMFVRRDVYRRAGGLPGIALMEDIELSRRLKIFDRPARLRPPVIASSRRWERHGVVRTILLMWTLRALYVLGVSPARLARWYN